MLKWQWFDTLAVGTMKGKDLVPQISDKNDSRAGYPVHESGLPVAMHRFPPRLSFSPLQLTETRKKEEMILKQDTFALN